MSDENEKEELARQFCSITGVEKERAHFYMQSAAWNMEAAMGAFYDDSNVGEEKDEQFSDEDNSEPEDVPFSRPPQPGPPQPGPPQAKGGGKRGVATLSDYRDQPNQPENKDAQQFFAGGSEHSGQMIEGPPRKRENPDSIAQGFIDAAKKHGAVPVEESSQQPPKSQAFHGTGFKLGDSQGPSQTVGSQVPPQSQEKVHHVLILWKNGFSVDDGPLRTGESKEDRKFIDSVGKGEIPEELRRSARHGEVDVDIKDQRDQEYVKPKPQMVAFSGEGKKLGSYAPEVKVSSSPKDRDEGATKSVATPPPTVPIDTTLPTTSLQIRLADGTRVTAKFNHTHTVNDIRQFINLSRPCNSNYVLMTTFPNKELSDPTLTLSQANLLNAVVVQRIR